MDKTQLLIEYAELKQSERQTKERIAEIAPMIVEMMEMDKKDKIKSDLGIFTVEHKKMWKYSHIVKEAEANLKKMQEKEKASGVAEFTENSYLKFFTPKEETQS